VADTDPGQTMSLSVTGLPAGLTVNWIYGTDGLDTGTVSGTTSAAAGKYNATLAAKDDTTGATSTVSFPVTVTGSMTASYYAGTNAVRLALNGKCMDANAASSANGTKIQIWTCYPSNAGETWSYVPNTYPGDPASGGGYGGTVRALGKCLDIV